MAFYKHVYELPFRGFTLDEFDTWKEVFNIAKKSDFSGITLKEQSQILYYQLATCNYNAALRTLNKFDQTPTVGNQMEVVKKQNKFLGLLLYWRCLLFQSHHEITETSRTHCKNLLDLCIEEYLPALLLIGNPRGNYYGLSLGLSFTSWLDNLGSDITNSELCRVLVQIGNNMINAGIDTYFIDNIRKIELSVMHNLYPPLLPDDSININVNETSLLDIEMALNGSNMSLLRCVISDIVQQNYKKRGESLGIIYEELESLMEVLFKILVEKISNNDKMGNDLLRVYGRTTDSCSNTLTIIHLNLIEICTNRVYQKTQIDGITDVDTITAYLECCLNASLKIDDLHKTACNKILVKCCSQGLLFLPTSPGNKIFESGYRQSSFKDGEMPKDLLHKIEEFIENYFWYGGDDVNQSYLVQVERVKAHHFILKLSPCLWKIAIYIIGLDITKEIINVKLVDQKSFVRVYCSLSSESTDYYNDLLNSMSAELIIIKIRYYKIFNENVDDYVLTHLLGRCGSMKLILKNHGNSEKAVTDLLERCGNMKLVQKHHGKSEKDVTDLLSLLYDFFEFVTKYTRRIKLHEIYKPEGEGYETARNQFIGLLK